MPPYKLGFEKSHDPISLIKGDNTHELFVSDFL